MASFTLGTAAQATGMAKSSVLRAIKAGRISANRDELGQWSIDPSELFRVFPPLAIPSATPAERPAERDAIRDATTAMLVDQLQNVIADLRRDRDSWRDAFERAQRLLPGPPERGATAAATAGTIAKPRQWWPWRRAG